MAAIAASDRNPAHDSVSAPVVVVPQPQAALRPGDDAAANFRVFQSDAGVQALLRRMSDGDRDAAAEFITRYGSKLRRRMRGKLNFAMRRLFDSQDILSTVGRRLDLYVRDGRLDVDDEAQLWALIFRMANHALVDKARLFERLQNVEGSDSHFASCLLDRLKRAEQHVVPGTPGQGAVESEVDLALRSLPDQKDRRILSLWLGGQGHDAIAGDVGLSTVAVRKRWQMIKQRLRSFFEAER